MRSKKFKYFIFAIVLNILSILNKSNCDLNLFSSEDIHTADKFQHDSVYPTDNFDRLHLFPSTKACSEEVNLDKLDKELVCKDYCLNQSEQLLPNEKANSTENITKSVFITQQQQKTSSSSQTEYNILNLTGALSYYRNFIAVFLANIKQEQESVEDFSKYKIVIGLSKHEIYKLERFSNSLNDSDAADSIQDITDILKDMFIDIESNRTPSLTDSLRDVMDKIKLIDAILIKYVFIFSVLVFVSALFYAYFRKFGLNLTWRKIMGIVFFCLFALSVFNNHLYLSQKKQILNQQKLKEIVPEECLIKNGVEQKTEDKNVYSKLMGLVKFQLGYTATSRRCLEYHEALFITSSQNNYVETIVYTISEGVRPVATLFGEFINQFFSALTKDLSFYQYLPLIGLVTTVFVPLGLILLCLISLMLFGYDFNFFHLISFKKNKTATESPRKSSSAALEYKKEDLLKILSLLKNESEKLSINLPTYEQVKKIQYSSVDSTENKPELLSIEDSSSNETLENSIHKIFEKINNDENCLKKQIEAFKSENEKLRKQKNMHDTSEEEIEEARSSESNSSMEKELGEEIIKTCKEVSIGLSKTVKSSAQQTKNQTKSKLKYQQEIDEEDDEEDIFVILDEN